MPKLRNASARLVTIPIVTVTEREDGSKMRVASSRISFPPGKLVRISRADFNKIKDVYLFKKMMDEKEMLEGQDASQGSITDEDVEKELEKDLDAEETE